MRRRFNRGVLLLALITAMAMALPAMAEQVDVYENKQLVKSVVFKIGVPYYVVNNQEPGVKMDVAPFIKDNRTFVPVRFLGNALGVTDDNINWNNDVQRVFIAFQERISLVMQIGVKEIQVNGVSKPIDVAPVLTSDRTFLPARFVAEGLGYEVDWDEATQTVICWPKGEPKPDVSGAVAYLTQFVEQQPQQPVGETFTTRAGYQIPKETKLVIPKDIKELGPGDPNRCELDFGIDLTKGGLESQWADAAYILGQKLDSQTVGEVMAYVKQKTDWKQGLAFKTWESSGKKVGVSSMGGSDGIQITVWYK